jgi:hypothetical protein
MLLRSTVERLRGHFGAKDAWVGDPDIEQRPSGIGCGGGWRPTGVAADDRLAAIPEDVLDQARIPDA